MNWRRYLPRSTKRRLRAAKNTVRQWIAPPQMSRDELAAYWQAPDDGANLPEEFFGSDYDARTAFVVEIVRECTPTSILELGCGAGRNLKALHDAGFRNLTGVELNATAVRMMRASFPDVKATIHAQAIEDVIRTLTPSDFVLCAGIMQHLHSDSEGAFPEIARVANKHLFLIEDELRQGFCDFPRNYRAIFERFGFQQLRERSGLELGLNGGVMARLFERRL